MSSDETNGAIGAGLRLAFPVPADVGNAFDAHLAAALARLEAAAVIMAGETAAEAVERLSRPTPGAQRIDHGAGVVCLAVRRGPLPPDAFVAWSDLRNLERAGWRVVWSDDAPNARVWTGTAEEAG